MLRFAAVAALLLTACGSTPDTSDTCFEVSPEGNWTVTVEGECQGELTLYTDSSRRLTGEMTCGALTANVLAQSFFCRNYIDLAMTEVGTTRGVWMTGLLERDRMTLTALTWNAEEQSYRSHAATLERK
jgi:hypothetical protein